MRCHKARRKLYRGDRIDQELLDHLNECQSCSRLVSAGELIEHALDSAREGEGSNTTPLSMLKARLANKKRKEISIMATFGNIFGGHRRLGFGVIIGVLAILFIVLVPLPYERTTGYIVQFSGVDKGTPTQEIMQALKSLGYDQLSVNVQATATGIDYRFSDLPNFKSAKEIAAAFASLSETKIAPEIRAVREVVSGSLYAQARNKVIQVEVDGKGKTDAEIKAEIEAKLAAQGFTGSLVTVNTGADGQRNVKLHIEEAMSDSTQQAGQMETIEIDGQGKTNEQIQNEIKAKLVERGHPNANISVRMEGPDSLRRIEIEIQDTTGH